MFNVEKSRALWAVLRNQNRVESVPSADWQQLLIQYHHHPIAQENRFSEETNSYTVTATEATALAASIDSDGFKCSGRLIIDLDFGLGARGSRMESAPDGLNPKERTDKLLVFLRQGSFSWTFESRELP